MESRVLFSGKHIYDLIENRQMQLGSAYEALQDDEALDEVVTQSLKKEFMLDVPTLRLNDWTSDRREISPYSTEIIVYIPFDGDPSVFDVQPSAFNGMIAYGEIVDHEILVRILPNHADFDIPAYVRNQLKEVEWRLNSLRGSMEHMSQQLEMTLRAAMQRRRRMIEKRVEPAQNIGIPQRPSRPAPVVEQKPVVALAKPVIKMEPSLESWDVFMSHASPDKPYVRGLVKSLRSGGITVWFDEDHIEWGESVPREIRKGLLNSRYGIVVLSKAYLAERKWTEHEFQGLLARETLDTTVILPLWHKVTEENIKMYDAPLTLRRAKISETDSYQEIVASIQRKLGRKVFGSDEKAPPPPHISKKLSSGQVREIGRKASGTWLAKNLLHLLGAGLEDTITVAEIQFSKGKFSYSGTNYTRRGEQCGQFTSEPTLVEKHRLSFLYDNSSSVTAHFAMGVTTINFPYLNGGQWSKYQATAKDSVRKVDITIQGYRADPNQYRKLNSGRPEEEREVIMEFIESFSNDVWV